MAANTSKPMDQNPDRADNTGRSASDSCSTPIDRKAPAGARNSLGAKSDCNGRPATDDSVVEAKDELDPAIPPPMPEPRSARR